MRDRVRESAVPFRFGKGAETQIMPLSLKLK